MGPEKTHTNHTQIVAVDFNILEEKIVQLFKYYMYLKHEQESMLSKITCLRRWEKTSLHHDNARQ